MTKWHSLMVEPLYFIDESHFYFIISFLQSRRIRFKNSILLFTWAFFHPWRYLWHLKKNSKFFFFGHVSRPIKNIPFISWPKFNSKSPFLNKSMVTISLVKVLFNTFISHKSWTHIWILNFFKLLIGLPLVVSHQLEAVPPSSLKR